MQPIGLTRAGILRPIVGYLGGIGAPVDEMLARVGLPSWVLTDPEMLIPGDAVTRLLGQAEREGIENVGVRAGVAARIESVGIFGRLIRCARTLADAVAALVDHHPSFSSNARMWRDVHDERVELCHAFVDPCDESWQQASHYVLMLLLGVVRLAAGRTWRPHVVRVQTGEGVALRDVAALSIAHVEPAQPSTAIVFPRALLAEPLRSPLDGDVPESFDAWKATAPAHDFVGSIVQVVETLSWERYPNIRATADLLGVSVRTLQRHLAAAGCAHEELVGRTRFATAATLLEETDTKILEIALDLGYSDHAHFTRAFRRWAGCSPQEFRCKRIASAAPRPRTSCVGRAAANT